MLIKKFFLLSLIIGIFCVQLTFAGVEMLFDEGFDTQQVNNKVYDLYKDGTHLYIAWAFTGVEGNALPYFARWDKTMWSGLNNPLVQNAGNAIYAMGVGEDLVFLGGKLGSKNYVLRNILNWDNSKSFEGEVYASKFIEGDIYIGGAFESISFEGRNHVISYANNAWATLWEGADGTVYAIDGMDWNHIYVGGSFSTVDAYLLNASNIAMRNGAVRSALGAGVDGPVYAIKATTDGKVYVGGNFSHAGGQSANNIAVWSWNTRYPLGIGVNGIVRSIEEGYQGEVYVGGSFDQAGGTNSIYVARWQNGQWTALSGLVTTAGGEVRALASYDGDLYIWGHFKKTWSSSPQYFAKYFGEYVTYITGYRATWRNDVTLVADSYVNPHRDQVKIHKGVPYDVIVTYKNNTPAVDSWHTLKFHGNWKAKGVRAGGYGEMNFKVKAFKDVPGQRNVLEN